MIPHDRRAPVTVRKARLAALRLLRHMQERETCIARLNGVDYEWDGAWSAAHFATRLEMHVVWAMTRTVLEHLAARPPHEEPTD